MTELNDVVVLSGTRTAIGRYGGSLKDIPPCDLAATVVREVYDQLFNQPLQPVQYLAASGNATRSCRMMAISSAMECG